LGRSDLPAYVSLELTDPGIFAVLHDLGYTRYKIIIQNNHRALRARPRGFGRTLLKRIPLYWRSIRNRLGLPAHTRKLVFPPTATNRMWKFPYGSSGPFGEWTGGEWLTFDEIAKLYDDFRNGRTEYGDPGTMIWHDVHAKRDG
jgi:hypothetical protein